MPTLIFLALAYQIQNIAWHYLLLGLTAISFTFNLYHGMWSQEVYSAAIVVLLFMLTPYFSRWWQMRNARNNPVSFLAFAKETYLIAKYNTGKILFWTFFLIASTVGVFFYAGLTHEALLSWLLLIFLLLFAFKNLFRLILPPEWFLHDINTVYVFLSVFIACWLSNLIQTKLGTHFITPMLLTTAFCLVGLFLVKQSNRYLIPGCALILADIAWQILRIIPNYNSYPSNIFITQSVLVITMLIGLVWLVKKPGVMPILYLALFQLFRFSGFTYEAINHAIKDNILANEATIYTIYLVCWMYIVPLLFWMVGLRQLELNGNTEIKPHPPRVNKKFEDLKKIASTQVS